MWLLVGSRRSDPGGNTLVIDSSLVVGRADCEVSSRALSRSHVRLDVAPDYSCVRLECIGNQAYVFGNSRRLINSVLGIGGVDFLRHAEGFFLHLNDGNPFYVAWHQPSVTAGEPCAAMQSTC